MRVRKGSSTARLSGHPLPASRGPVSMKELGLGAGASVLSREECGDSAGRSGTPP